MEQTTQKQMTLSDIQKCACGVLEYIDTICQANEIKYYLSFGTCLGAIRHKGMIPWDDDIDIYMTREDFRRFSAVVEKTTNNHYKLVYFDKERDYFQPLPKMIDDRTIVYQTQQNAKPIGVWVDIFILDNVPNEEKKQKRFLKRIDFLNKSWMFAIKKKKFSAQTLRGKIYQLINYGWTLLIPFRYLATYIDWYAQKYNNSDCDYCCNLTHTINPFGETLDKNILGNGILVPFEGHMYRAPEDYHTYLSKRYGNYMQLPPEEKRSGHRSNITYMK